MRSWFTILPDANCHMDLCCAVMQILYGEEEQHGSFQYAKPPSHNTHQDAESDVLSGYPSSSSVSAAEPASQAPAAVAGGTLVNALRPSSSSQAAALSGSGDTSSSPDGRVAHASSSSGIGRADSADASLEALLAELSSASATAAVTLAPFTASSAATAAAGSATDTASPSASPVYIQSFDRAQRGKAQHGKAKHASALHDSEQYKSGNNVTAAESTDSSSPQQLPASSASQPEAAPSDLTAQNVELIQTTYFPPTSAAPSIAPVSPCSSSSALPAAAASASSLSAQSSSHQIGSSLGSQLVAKLQGELRQHQETLNDDLAFIQEVQTHQTLAAGMNPSMELQSLHRRFNNWKFDFKV